MEVALRKVLYKDVLLLNLRKVLSLKLSHVGQGSDWEQIAPGIFVDAVAKLLDC